MTRGTGNIRMWNGKLVQGADFDIPYLPTCLASKEEVQEVPLHELTPVGRKFYTPIRTQCCVGAGYHLYRSRWCDCRTRFYSP